MKQNTIIEQLRSMKVEWETIEDVFHLKNGYTPSKSNKEFWEDGTIPWFRMEDLRENGRILDFALQKISQSAVKGGKVFSENSIIMATSATIGEHALITVPYLANQRFTNLTLKDEFKDKLDIKFVFYYCFNLADWCKKNTTMSSFASVDMVGFKKFPFPIPPIETQKEIVKTLDKLTELEATLEATLEAELSLRKKQYEYYRNALLTFEQDLDRGGWKNNHFFCKELVWRKLGEVTEYSQTRISFNLLDEKNYVGVDNLLQNRAGKTLSNYVPTSGSFTEYQQDDILIGNIRPYLKKIWQADCTGGTNGDVLVIHTIDKNVHSRYLYQILADDKFFAFNMQNAKGAKMPRGNKNAILQYEFPLPDLPTQQKIVEILDKFDRLTNSITEGLPKEIELRRKQYEYYREQLLTFPKDI